MKIYCEPCRGSGVFKSGLGPIMCANCEGKGYTVNETIEHEARVGRATIKAYENNLKLHEWDTIAERVDYVAWDVESLLDWAEGDE